MSYTPATNENYDHLKKMKKGDIWVDIHGDYFLVTEVYKYNVRSKTKKFFIMVDAILMTANHKFDDEEYFSGDYIQDYNPSLIKEKVA